MACVDLLEEREADAGRKVRPTRGGGGRSILRAFYGTTGPFSWASSTPCVLSPKAAGLLVANSIRRPLKLAKRMHSNSRRSRSIDGVPKRFICSFNPFFMGPGGHLREERQMKGRGDPPPGPQTRRPFCLVGISQGVYQRSMRYIRLKRKVLILFILNLKINSKKLCDTT